MPVGGAATGLSAEEDMITKEMTAAVRDAFGKRLDEENAGSRQDPGNCLLWRKRSHAARIEQGLFNELIDIQGRNAVITLKIDNGSEKNTIVQEIQTDPVKIVCITLISLRLI